VHQAFVFDNSGAEPRSVFGMRKGQLVNTAHEIPIRVTALLEQTVSFRQACIRQEAGISLNRGHNQSRDFGSPGPNGSDARAVSAGTFLVARSLVDKSIAFSTSLVLRLTWPHSSASPITMGT
jgi:hypothetical protein